MAENMKRPVWAYFGHHKCASTWVVEIVMQVAVETGRRHLLVVDDLTPQANGPLRDRATLTEHETTFERSELRAHVEATRADFVSCVTADRQQAEILCPFRGVHVIRDPRDIIVSAYFSHRNSHPVDNVPHMAAHRQVLREVTSEEGLLLEMDFSGNELREMGDWDYGNEDILELKMEEMTAAPYDTFISIFRHFELLSDDDPTTGSQQIREWAARLANRVSRRQGWGWLRRELVVNGDLLLGAVYARRFEAKTKGRAKGSEDVASHYRKGIAGDWVSHFTPEHAEAFEQRFGDLLFRLGYETDDAWLDQVGATARRA